MIECVCARARARARARVCVSVFVYKCGLVYLNTMMYINTITMRLHFEECVRVVVSMKNSVLKV